MDDENDLLFDESQSSADVFFKMSKKGFVWTKTQMMK